MAFRRRNKDAENTDAGDTPELDELQAEDPAAESEVVGVVAEPVAEVADDGAPAWPTGIREEREGGPWDSADAPEDKVERVDLGGVLVPIVSGMELRAEINEDQVVAVTLIIGRSALQIQPFAAPRTIGIWADVRAEIAAGVTESGGHAVEEQGRFGTELVADVGVALPDGSTGMQTARFLGVDGPRWFLRAVITGEGAVDAAARAPLEDLLADVVVVRGEDAMAPRDAIGLRLPEEVEIGEAGEQFTEGESEDGIENDATRVDDLKPFERGPEITEVR